MGDFPGANDRDLVVVFNDGKQLSASLSWVFDSFVINSFPQQFQIVPESDRAEAVDMNGAVLTSPRYLNQIMVGLVSNLGLSMVNCL